MNFHCPKCNHDLKAKEELAGKRVKCPACQGVITIPNRELNDQENQPILLPKNENKHIQSPNLKPDPGENMGKSSGAEKSNLKFEYKFVSYSMNNKNLYELRVGSKSYVGNSIVKYFNYLGDQGWEIIACIPEIGYDVKDTSSKVSDLFAPLGPGVSVSHLKTIGHSIWLKRLKN